MNVHSRLVLSKPFTWYEIDVYDIHWTQGEMEFYFNIHHYLNDSNKL